MLVMVMVMEGDGGGISSSGNSSRGGVDGDCNGRSSYRSGGGGRRGGGGDLEMACKSLLRW